MISSASLGTPRVGSYSDDEERTNVVGRYRPMRWDSTMFHEIMRELEGETAKTVVPSSLIRPTPVPSVVVKPLPPPPPRPNVFQRAWAPGDPPLPWVLWACDEESVVKRPRRAKARRRSVLPWLVVAMWAGIAFGVSADNARRHEIVSQLRATQAQVVAVLADSLRW